MEHLFTHQQAVVPDVLRALRPDNPTVLVAPTGCGKTIIAAEIALHFKTVLWVAHRIELIDQAKAENGRNVQVMSVSAALRHGPRFVDLLIIDEAHRGMAATYRSLIEKYSGACVLGLTATPMRTDGQGLIDVFSEIVQCSNVKELIDSGYLVPYRALEARDEALKQLEDMRKRRGDYDQSQLSALMSVPRLVGDVVKEYKKHATGRKAVAFCVSIKHSQMLAEAFMSAGVKAAHLDGSASLSLRTKKLELLRKGKIDVLCNVNLFTEGWDCPSVSCVIMARPTQSLTLYLQCVGRGMRTCEGKENLLILDHAGNIARHGYPDDPREWSLESHKQRLSREAEIAELERLHALGFDSIEDELEEKARRFEETYSAGDVARIMGWNSRGVAGRLKAMDLGILIHGVATRYPKRIIDEIADNFSKSISIQDISRLPHIGIIRKSVAAGTDNLGRALRVAGVFPQKGRGWPGWTAARYLRSEIEQLLCDRQDTVTSAEAAIILGIDQPKSLVLHLRPSGIGPVRFGHYLRSDIEGLRVARDEYYSAGEARRLLRLTNAYNLSSAARHLGIRIAPEGMIGTRGGKLYSKNDIDLVLDNFRKSLTVKEVSELPAMRAILKHGRPWKALSLLGVLPQSGVGWPPARSRHVRYLRSDIEALINSSDVSSEVPEVTPNASEVPEVPFQVDTYRERRKP